MIGSRSPSSAAVLLAPLCLLPTWTRARIGVWGLESFFIGEVLGLGFGV